MASGSTDTFTVPFPYLDKTHVKVLINGVLLTSLEYTWPTDGTIKITAGNPSAGALVERRRETPKDAIVTFFSGNLDTSDLNVSNLQPLYLAQEADDDAADALFRGWFTKGFLSGGTIEKGAEGDVVAFDANGNLVAYPPVSDVNAIILGLPSRAYVIASYRPIIAPDYMRTAGYALVGDGGGALYKKVVSEPSHAGKMPVTTRAGATVWYEFAECEVSLFQLGAKGDSTPFTTGSGTDDTTAWNNTAAVAVALRIPMVIPRLPTNKAFRLTARTDYPLELTIKGEGADITVGLTTNYPNGGSWVYLDHLGEGLYFRDDANVGASRKFARLKGWGVVRNQAAPGPGWTPSAASYDLRVEYNVDMEDMVFLSSSKIALVRSAGQLQTRRVRGQPLIVGYECERSSDVQRWDGDHWWPYWSQDANVKAYTIANSLGYKVRRADGLMITNPFSIWYKRLFFGQDASGDGSGLANFHIKNPYADIGGGGIEIVSDFYPAYGTIDGYLCNSSVDGAPSDGAGFRLRGAVASQIELEMRSNRSPEEAIYVSGAAHRVNVKSLRAYGWAFVTSGRHAVKAENGARIEFLSTPDLDPGDSNQYSQDATSAIIFPSNYQLGRSAALPTGLYSRRVTIADDAVAIIDPPGQDLTCNLHLCPLSPPANGNPAGSFWGRATGSPACTTINVTHPTNTATSTSVLTGTTGTDGNLTVSFANSGKIYIENRTGVSRTFLVTMLGN